jgi:hypothetical protein
MSVSNPRMVTGIGAGLLAAGVCSGAWSTPVKVQPGATDIPVPTYTGTGKPTVDLLFDTGDQSKTEHGITVDFEEFAVRTSLNPAGVSFGFAITSSNDPKSLDAVLDGYGGFLTSVESCDPFTEETVKVCGTSTGTVSRSHGKGDTLSFKSLGTTAVSLPMEPPLYASNVYGLFTNARGWTDPMVTVTDDGTSFSFKGVAPAETKGVPEPATLGLLGLGLLGTLITRRRQRQPA